MNKQLLGISTLTWSHTPVLTAINKAKELNFKWIDLGILNNWTDITPELLAKDFEHYLTAIEQELEATNLCVASINSNFGKNHAEIEAQCLALCKAAKRLNSAAGVTFPSGNPNDGWNKGLDELKIAYKIFKEQGVNLMVETHCFQFTENIDDTMRLLDRFPGLRLTLDASHYIVQGYQPDDWKKLLPWVSHCHIRPCGNQGFDTIQVELDQAVPHSLNWPQSMLEWGYTGLFTFEIIDEMKIENTSKTTMTMYDSLLK
ncbi:sugar phosphate isomerase/epimerase family protein [Gracilibacillus phocaeensis]|uniref:sugar phosphate isomerase/epimerase family protein n=1 Tax=Gracilibacillus phocaeensis TaxID=2042304 RepID=UPI0010308998|nr:sugar phosphate isomerase/epimerase [Gracilibacillus phocaeensis]